MDRKETGRAFFWDVLSRDFRQVDGKLIGSPYGGGGMAVSTIASRIAHHVLQIPFRIAGSRYARFRRFEQMTKTLVIQKGFDYDYQLQRHVLTLSLLTRYLSLDGMDTPAVVIGDGRGAMASTFLACIPKMKIVLVNLIRPLLYDLLWLRRLFPELSICLANSVREYLEALSDANIRLVAVRADDAIFLSHAPIGIAINMVSMQEMLPKTIAFYFDILRRSPNRKTAFYCCNAVERTLVGDGLITRFDEYPWHPDDVILFDGGCPFTRYWYQFRIPFYSWFSSFPHKHRLVFLAKKEITTE